MPTAFVFPGQGEQKPGMMTDLIRTSRPVKQTLIHISDLTSVDIIGLCRQGTEVMLNDGVNSGLIVVASAVSLFHHLQESGFSASAYAGYSVGQYSALYAAGLLELKDLCGIVKLRQTLLNEAANRFPSNMIGVLGVPLIRVQEIVDHFSDAVISNINCPNNYSIACRRKDVADIIHRLEKAGAIKAVSLPVVGGWHSSFMKWSSNEISPALESLPLKNSTNIFIDNVTGDMENDLNKIRENLKKHIFSPVLWESCVRTLDKKNISRFVEVGYGNQLSKFIAFSLRHALLYQTGTESALDRTLSALGQGSYK